MKLSKKIEQFQVVKLKNKSSGENEFMIFMLIDGRIHKTEAIEERALHGIIDHDFELRPDEIVIQDEL